MTDKIGEWRNGVSSGCAVNEVPPKREAVLATGFLQTCKGGTALAPQIAPGPPADFAFLDMLPDVPFAAVGMQRHFWARQHQEQLRFVAVQSLERLVQGRKRRLLGKDLLKARGECDLPLLAGLEFVAFEVSLVVPDLPPDRGELRPLGFSKREEFVNGALGVHPTQAVTQDIELARVITDDRQIAQEAVAQRSGQQGAFRRNAHVPSLRDPQARQMGVPSGRLRKAVDGMLRPCLNKGAGQLLGAEVRERLGIHAIVGMARLQ